MKAVACGLLLVLLAHSALCADFEAAGDSNDGCMREDESGHIIPCVPGESGCQGTFTDDFGEEVDCAEEIDSWGFDSESEESQDDDGLPSDPKPSSPESGCVVLPQNDRAPIKYVIALFGDNGASQLVDSIKTAVINVLENINNCMSGAPSRGCTRSDLTVLVTLSKEDMVAFDTALAGTKQRLEWDKLTGPDMTLRRNVVAEYERVKQPAQMLTANPWHVSDYYDALVTAGGNGQNKVFSHIVGHGTMPPAVSNAVSRMMAIPGDIGHGALSYKNILNLNAPWKELVLHNIMCYGGAFFPFNSLSELAPQRITYLSEDGTRTGSDPHLAEDGCVMNIDAPGTFFCSIEGAKAEHSWGAFIKWIGERGYEYPADCWTDVYVKFMNWKNKFHGVTWGYGPSAPAAAGPAALAAAGPAALAAAGPAPALQVQADEEEVAADKEKN